VANTAGFSQWLLQQPEAANQHAMGRIAIAKKRIPAVLDRDTVACQRTLEQKISEQGPSDQRVDPHLVGLALKDMLELGRLRKNLHVATSTTKWFSNLITPQELIDKRLDELAPLYSQVAGAGFGNLTGDALEIITFKCLDEVHRAKPRYVYQGFFDLDPAKKNLHGRYPKVQPPKTVAGRVTLKEADFIQFGYDDGGLCIECKNYREWLYPNSQIIKDLIIKSIDLGLIPVLIHRRIHYTAITNLLEPAGIIAHESYYQYYPDDAQELATKVKHKRSLGFTDVTASEEPHPRTRKFISDTLPKIVPRMASKWVKNRNALFEYATSQINLAQLYTEIGSPAGGKWKSQVDGDPSNG